MKLSEAIAPAFYPVHAALRAGRAAEVFLKGGRGSAKSSFISIEIVLGILKHPGANAIIYRKVAATIRESVYEQMLWAVEKLGLRDYFQPKLSPPELVYLPTGQRILFRGADDPGKSKSLKLSNGYFKYLWLEELSEFSGMEDVRSIKASVIRGGGAAVTFCSYNPPASQSNWVNAEAMLPRPGRLVHHSDYRGVPRAWLGESFIAEAEALKASNARAYAHVYLGEVTGTGGQVFDNLSLRAIPDAEIRGFDRLLNGLDFGFAVDPDAFIRVFYDAGRRRLFVAEEFFGVRTPTDRLAERILNSARGETVHCDSADPRMIQELRARGISAVGAKKGPGSVRDGIRWMQEQGEIVIDPARCPNAAREFSGYEYLSDVNGNFRADCPDKDNHFIDAARYALEDLIQHRAARTIRRVELGF